MKKSHTLLAAALCLLSATGAGAQILVGQTAGLSGPVAASVNETIEGAKLVIDAVNAQGGIAGEKIEMIRMDDGFDVQRAAENARILVEEKKVVALFMTRGTPHSQAVLPLLEKYDVPLIAPSTGAMTLHKPVRRVVFNVRSTYQREAEKAIQHLLTIGITRIAVVHVADSFGRDALEGAMKGLRDGKQDPAVIVAVDRDEPNYARIIPKLAEANAQAVLWFGSSEAVAAGVKALRESGSTAQVVTLSNNASAGFIKQLGSASGGVVVTQVFPNERSIGHPMVKEALSLARANGQKALSPAALEGFAAAKVLVEALRRAAPRPTRGKLLAALESLRNYDIGGLEISYSPQDHSGIDFTELSIISGGQFKR